MSSESANAPPFSGTQADRQDSIMCNVSPTGPNTQTGSKKEDLPAGAFLRSVMPVLINNPTAPRGRYYAQILLWRKQYLICETLWSGYVTNAQQVSSIVNKKIRPRDSLQIVVWAGTQGVATAVFGVMACFGYADDKGAYLVFEQPGGVPGTGDVFSIGFTNPAAGADFANYNMAAFTRQLVKAFRAQLVTAVAVANRSFKVNYRNPSNVVEYTEQTVAQQAASLTVDYDFCIYGQRNTGQGTIPRQMQLLPEIVLTSSGGGWSLQFVTDNIQAADQWSNGTVTVEEWVHPFP